MGANEKHAATYHSGEYTPDAEQVRASFANSGIHRERPAMKAGFDRWLDRVRAEAKAEAWEEGWSTGWGDAWDNAKNTSNKVTTSNNPYKEN